MLVIWTVCTPLTARHWKNKAGWTLPTLPLLEITSFCPVVKTSARTMDPMVMSKYVHGVMIMIGGLSLLFAVFTILYLICGLLPLWLKRLRKNNQREQHQFPIDVEAGNPRSAPILPPLRLAPPYQPTSVTHPPQRCSPPAPQQVPQTNRVSIPGNDSRLWVVVIMITLMLTLT